MRTSVEAGPAQGAGIGHAHINRGGSTERAALRRYTNRVSMEKEAAGR